MFPLDLPEAHRHEWLTICEHWHNGQWSSMYSVLSTGRIHNADTLAGLESELRQVAREATADDAETCAAFLLWVEVSGEGE